jgi:hypothetical protein
VKSGEPLFERPRWRAEPVPQKRKVAADAPSLRSFEVPVITTSAKLVGDAPLHVSSSANVNLDEFK